jgi:hypothetical protein
MVMPAVKIPSADLLADIRPGLWVAISQDQDRVVCTGETVEEVLRKVREDGEKDPVIMRVPPNNSAWIL